MAKGKNLISAVIAVVEKDKKHLDGCIASLETSAKYAQTKLKFILIANGVKLSPKKYPPDKFKIIANKKNVGFGQAINQGMRVAKGKWCIIACPDTKSVKTCIKRLILYTKEKNIALIAPQIILPDHSIQATILPLLNLWDIFIEQSYLYKLIPSIFSSPLSNTLIYQKCQYVEVVAAVWCLIKRDAFLNIGGFDERFFLYFEDLDLCIKLRKKGYKIIFDPASQIIHIAHQGTGGNVSGKFYKESLKLYLSKYHSRIYTVIALNIFTTGCIIRLLYWFIRVRLTKDIDIRQFGLNKINFCKEVINSSFTLN